MKEVHPNIKYLISYKGEFFWNGRFRIPGEPRNIDAKLFWTMKIDQAFPIDELGLAQALQKKFFPYPTRVIETFVDSQENENG